MLTATLGVGELAEQSGNEDKCLAFEASALKLRAIAQNVETAVIPFDITTSNH
jgi:hypothetical protein